MLKCQCSHRDAHITETTTYIFLPPVELFCFNKNPFCFHADRDFEPPCEEEDDEETIEVEEQQEGNDAESHRREIELLKEEGMLPLDQLLSTLKLPQVPPQTAGWIYSNKSRTKCEELLPSANQLASQMSLTWWFKCL